MARDPRVLLWDAISAARKVANFVEARSVAEFVASDLLRSAVERQCEIIGEALNRLRAIAPDVAHSIADLPRAVAFRNLLIHGYAQIDAQTVWRIATTDVPRLADDLADVLASLDRPSG
jgi:uncharacterized protein with HEPN domain